MATITIPGPPAPCPPSRPAPRPAPHESARAGSAIAVLWSVAAPRAFLLLAMVVVVALGLAPVLSAPAVVPAGAPPAEFSAERAMRYVEAIATEPHAPGSPAHAAVQAYLVDR